MTTADGIFAVGVTVHRSTDTVWCMPSLSLLDVTRVTQFTGNGQFMTHRGLIYNSISGRSVTGVVIGCQSRHTYCPNLFGAFSIHLSSSTFSLHCEDYIRFLVSCRIASNRCSSRARRAFGDVVAVASFENASGSLNVVETGGGEDRDKRNGSKLVERCICVLLAYNNGCT